MGGGLIGTFQALAVAVLALLPGASYTWAFERQVSVSRAGVADRLLRLLGASAVFLALALPALYQLYRVLVVTGRLRNGAPLPWWAWLFPYVFLLVPTIAGHIVGRATYRHARWVRPLIGPASAPRAWDHLFLTPKLTGWVRLKLTGGAWVFGAWSSEDSEGSEDSKDVTTPRRSYAAGYPEVQDLYFVDTADIDENGVVQVDATGFPVLRGRGLLVRWDQVVYAEYIKG